MDGAELDQYEARLKELFDSFDLTGSGSLGQEELSELCRVLHLEEVAPGALEQTLLQDNLRVRPSEHVLGLLVAVGAPVWWVPGWHQEGTHSSLGPSVLLPCLRSHQDYMCTFCGGWGSERTIVKVGQRAVLTTLLALPLLRTQQEPCWIRPI